MRVFISPVQSISVTGSYSGWSVAEQGFPPGRSSCRTGTPNRWLGVVSPEKHTFAPTRLFAFRSRGAQVPAAVSGPSKGPLSPEKSRRGVLLPLLQPLLSSYPKNK